MKIHFRSAALVIAVISIIYAELGNSKAFLTLLSVAFEIYSMTEMQADWSEKFNISNLHVLWRKRYKNSISGAAAGIAAPVLLFAALVLF